MHTDGDILIASSRLVRCAMSRCCAWNIFDCFGNCKLWNEKSSFFSGKRKGIADTYAMPGRNACAIDPNYVLKPTFEFDTYRRDL